MSIETYPERRHKTRPSNAKKRHTQSHLAHALASTIRIDWEPSLQCLAVSVGQTNATSVTETCSQAKRNRAEDI
ncbi:uncharacterized protein YALI1_A13593g [Yarrowia lipolytica]|uniref:Uncharacterized protein n=1 Tax=Yarrowia lipolytica TaxID=4952 RepID=A0A1D8N4P8_YARLL|nr:hypothetical protein YALI1_A13593g [Yarrowia lipolytica]